jgi:bacteriocin-like protein
MEKTMSKTNDTSKLDRAPQVRELRDDELQEVSGGVTMEDILVTSVLKSDVTPWRRS